MQTLYKKFNNILIFFQIKKKVKRKYTRKIKINKEVIVEKPIILTKEKTQQEIVLQFLRLYNILSKKKTKIYRGGESLRLFGIFLKKIKRQRKK